MRKLNLFVGALAIVALASCSNDEVVSNVESAQLAQQSIGFSPLTKGATRAGIVNVAADLNDFAVSGFTAAAISGDRYIESATVTTLNLAAGAVYAYGSKNMQNIKVVYSDGGWNYDNAAQMMYWPFVSDGNNNYTSNDALNFSAVSPAAAAAASTGADGVELKNENYTIKNYVVGNDDLCFAEKSGATQGDGQVALEFKHLLSQIKFAAKKASGMTVYINNIALGAIPNKGDKNSKTSTDKWTLVDPTTEVNTYSVLSAETEITSTDTPQELGESIIVLPQKAADNTYSLEAGTTIGRGQGDPTSASDPTPISSDNGKKNIEASGKIYLKVSVKAQAAGGTWLIGDASTYKDIYFWVKTEWLMRTKHTYYLLFGGVSGPGTSTTDTGGGTNIYGEKEFSASPITFSASITDWTEGDGINTSF